MGRFDEELGREVSAQIASWVPDWEAHVEAGNIKPVDWMLLDGKGWDKVLEGIAIMEGKKADKKMVVRVSE
jgi:hypothetical protein